MAIKDGFAGERLCVVPAPAVAQALRAPVTRKVVVTDAGWFPNARYHGRTRPQGIAETIVIVCTKGAGWIDLPGARHRLSAGMAAVIPAHTPHSYGATDDHPWTIWWCHVTGSDVADLVSATGTSTSRPLLRLRSVDRSVAILDEIVGHLERDQTPITLLAVAGAGFKLMTQLTIDQTLPQQGNPLERAMTYLAQRLDGQVRVSELATMVGVSTSHLTSLFRAATGGGVLAYHTALRMTAARTLLERSDLAINEVAAEVGYGDPYYFSRHFRRVHGMSPSAYRAERAH